MKIEIKQRAPGQQQRKPTSWKVECIEFGETFLFEGHYYIRAGEDNHAPNLSEAAGVALDNGEVQVVPFGTQVIPAFIKGVAESQGGA